VRLGIFTDALAHRPLADALDWLAAELPDVGDVEVGTGGYSPAPHAGDLAQVDSRGFRLAALNVSGNPLEVADHDRALRETIRLAATLGVDRVICMSGGRPELAGAGWFPGIEEATERYWEERVLPYWEELTALARTAHPALRLCFELEPGAAVFNVSTFERVASCGENLAVNLDPSHFFWQEIDPLAAVARLGGRVAFAHGKDTVMDPDRVPLDGLMDRSAWRYATAGRGHDLAWWRSFVSALDAAGYDGVISIEYEDTLVPAEESVVEAARLLGAAMTVRA
jgi:sugar phosphate isomerase/epimerase